MHFLFLYLSFTLFLSYETIKPPGLIFSVMPLSHDGLLITWDPNEVPNARDTYFRAYFQRVEERTRREIPGVVHCMDGQFKTPVLNENTVYRLTIQKFVTNEEPPTMDEYIIEEKTGLKTNVPPAKPSFTYYKEDTLFTQEKGPALKIRWLPCGAEKNCNGQTAGGHFIIKYRMLNSNHSFSIVRFTTDFGFIYNLLASRTYEVKVASILGDYETESDPHSPNSGSLRFDPYVAQHLLRVDSTTDHLQARLNDLTPDTEYTFYLFPETSDGPGFESRIDFTPHTYEPYLPLATPDFNNKILSNCSILIQWLPCGSSFCRNSRPGSSFSVQYRDSDGTLAHIFEERRDYVILDAKVFQTYDISVQSVDGPHSSEPVVKRINISQC